jgi:hypothetical protein
MVLSKKTRLVVLLAVLIPVAFYLLVGLFEKQIVGWLMPTKGWVTFNVPSDARQVRASAQKSGEGLNICNDEGFDWSDITIKVLGLYNAPYLARLKSIKAGHCDYLPFSDFAEPSWKRMQMPPNEVPTKVEILVGYRATGYASLEPK